LGRPCFIAVALGVKVERGLDTDVASRLKNGANTVFKA